MTIARLAAALTTFFAACANLSADVTIADLAPRESFVVFSVDEWSALHAAYERTPLRELWANERVRAFLLETIKETYGDPADLLGAIDELHDIEDLAMPAGSIGGALFFEEDAEGVVVMRALLMCDFADNDEDADNAWRWLEDAVDSLVATKSVERTYSDHGDVEIVTVTPLEEVADVIPVEDEMNAELDDEDEWWMDEHDQGPSVFDGPHHVARVGSVMLVSTSTERLHDAIDRLNGVELGPTLRDNKDYLDTLAQHTPGAHAHGALLLRATKESLEQLADGPLGDTLATALPGAWFFLDSIAPMMEPLGLDAVHAAGLSFRLDTPDAIAEVGYSALIPEKRGVLSLFDGPARPFTLPAFVGADAAGVNVIRINFNDIPRIVRSVIAAMPEEERGFMMEQAEFALAQIEPVLAVMSPEMISVTRIERPFSALSKSSLYAVPITQSQPVTDALTMFGQFAGLQARDFQGNQIWEAEFVPMAVGVGFGHVFIGPPSAIESAMREAGAPDAPKLSAEPRFARAASALARDGVGFLYQDTEVAITYAAWIAANMDRVIDEQLRTMGLNPGDEYYEEFRQSMRGQQPESLKMFPPPEDFTRELGDSTSDIRSTNTGYVGRWLLLRPQR